MLEAISLQCERGGRTLFGELSFAVKGGEPMRIAGPNGSGKSSLLRILCGLLAPSRGEVRWQGSDIRGLREEFSRHIVYLGHAPAVKGDLTAAENLSIAATLAGLSAPPRRVDEALERFGLPPDAQVRKLSQGQRRRAALARLSLSETVPLWLLDEPFSALDAPGVALVADCLSQHGSRGGGVVFTTHEDPGVAATHVLKLG
jgi:heme exporter protein A